MSYLAGKLNDQERKDLAAEDPAFAKAFAAADEFLLDRSQRMRYVNRQMEILDYNTNIAAAKEEGKAEGIQETESRMVSEMLNMNSDIDYVSKVTKWTKERILAFAREHNLPVKQ